MKVKIETDEYTIYERRDGRFAVQDGEGRPINGAQKIEILLAHELIVAVLPKVEEPSDEAAGEESTSDGAEAEAEARMHPARPERRAV